ncbi:MAG: TonB-dependent receptor [Cytophagales bacterium]|nr:TonB-dependent receptor [Cytophagales bacterium]MDW8383581.1 TonB-dependent receptor [Flammeovirgaceae bacterium]
MFKKLIAFLMIYLACAFVYAQDRMIRGKVTSKDSPQGLPGVNVLVKGTTNGTITDMDGVFNLSVPENAVLVFSFVGYQTKEIALSDNQTEVNVVMEEDIKLMEEVIVVGYGASSKQLITGSVSSVKSEVLVQTVTPSIDGALTGRTAGVQIQSASGTPGAAFAVKVRGGSSISGTANEPLYVIDGVPMTSGTVGSSGFGNVQPTNALSDLNPADIESIEVLKDAAAAAIYGARGANGVVLITTKSGAKGKTKINVNTSYGIQEPRRYYPLLNAEQYKQFAASPDVVAATGTVSNFDGNNNNTDWQKQIFRRGFEAPIQNHEISMSGGKEKTKFFTSVGYFRQDGILRGTSYERYTQRLNIDHEINDKVRIGLKTGNTFSFNDRQQSDNDDRAPINNAMFALPTAPIYNPDGTFNTTNGVAGTTLGNIALNPVVTVKAPIFLTENFRNITNAYVDWDITDKLTLKHQWGIDYATVRDHAFRPLLLNKALAATADGLGAFSNQIRLLQQTYLSYSETFNDAHNVTLMGGWSFERMRDRFLTSESRTFPTDLIQYQDGDPIFGRATAVDVGFQSFFGRIQYDYKAKYLWTLNYRIDGSSRFGKKNRYGNFPGVSLGWRVSEEGFWQSLKKTISEFKIRGGWGIQGNDRIGNFSFLSTYGTGSTYSSATTVNAGGLVITRLANPRLRWEQTEQYNVGVDLGLLKDRVTATVDLYYKHTTGILFSVPIASSTGFTSYLDNVGSLENRGLEVSFNTANVKTESFSWTSSFNITFNRNKLLSMYPNAPDFQFANNADGLSGSNRAGGVFVVGQPIGTFFLLQYQGVDPATGDPIYLDKNGDGKIDPDNSNIALNDRVFYDPNPRHFGGFTNDFKYKNFDMNIFFQWTYGNLIHNQNRYLLDDPSSVGRNKGEAVLDRWQKPGDVTYVPRAGTPFGGQATIRKSSYALEDGSFLRLKNFSIGYNLPKSSLEKIKIASLRVYIMTQNLLTFTNYSGLDPEVNFSGPTATIQGQDRYTYPQARTYTLGLNIGF